ncbi:fungal-specific transcription factor domain-containing protein [Aspergillus nidulans var. acristatus]
MADASALQKNEYTLLRHMSKRSKTGCLICRRRKKKCDEVHPTCGGCARNHLRCQWAEDVYSRSRRPRRRICRNRLWPSGLVIPRELDGMVTIFAVPSRPIIYRLLAHFTECSPVWMSISPGWRRDQFLHHVIPTALGHSLTLDCLLALSAGDLMKYKLDEPELRMIYLELYGKAVAGLRTAVDRELYRSTEAYVSDDIVLAVLLLCVHETHNFSDTSRLLPHLNAAAFLLQQRISSTPSDPSLRAFLLEIFCYFFSLTSFTHGSSLILDRGSEIFDSIDYHTGQSLLLGPSQDLIITIFRITRLTLHPPYMSEIVRSELASIEFQLEAKSTIGQISLALHDPGEQMCETVNHLSFSYDDRVVFELYRVACLIFVKQAIDPLISPRAPELQKIVGCFVSELETLPHESPSNGLLAWPLVITGFCAVAHAHKRIILARLRIIHKTWRTDIFPQTVDFLRRLWGLDTDESATPNEDTRVLSLNNHRSSLWSGFMLQNLGFPTVLV